jgi:hypothetical protein
MFRVPRPVRAAAAPCALAAALLASTARAQTSWLSPDRFAIGATVGTDGAGGELQYSLNRYLTLRGRGAWLDFDYSGNSGEVHYNAKIKLSEGGGFADIHPFANPFTVSIGAVAGPRRGDVNLYYRRNVTVDGASLTPAQLGTGGGRVTLSSPAPFVGLGFDNTFTHPGHWGFKLTAGVAFSHPPDVSLAPTSGLAAQMPQLIAPYIAEVEHDVRHDGQFLAYYPQISAGVNYRF